MANLRGERIGKEPFSDQRGPTTLSAVHTHRRAGCRRTFPRKAMTQIEATIRRGSRGSWLLPELVSRSARGLIVGAPDPTTVRDRLTASLGSMFPVSAAGGREDREHGTLGGPMRRLFASASPLFGRERVSQPHTRHAGWTTGPLGAAASRFLRLHDRQPEDE